MNTTDWIVVTVLVLVVGFVLFNIEENRNDPLGKYGKKF